ncbi:hypothetical protein Ahy_B08g092823 [Arachis hypogaea]|uniref:SWIM-type domain-containing protein n=1 Tax=Arachis hypogaea TaxID=3818 RepID=A0A444Y4Q2_ARAHY|nr:hypothetical protein Ahy_B08g092823 [Arachis hypogaea]
MRVMHCDRRASVFVSLHFPCRHALATCATASVEWGIYVHLEYKQEAVFKVYDVEFSLISDKKLWPKWYGTRLRPNPIMCRKATGSFHKVVGPEEAVHAVEDPMSVVEMVVAVDDIGQGIGWDAVINRL